MAGFAVEFAGCVSTEPESGKEKVASSKISVYVWTGPKKTTTTTATEKSLTARFIRGISAVSNAIQTKDNEANHPIIYCLNCIRHGRNAIYEPGLSKKV